MVPQKTNASLRWVLVLGLTISVLYSCQTPSIIATQSVERGNKENNLRHYNEAIVHYQKFLDANKSLGLYRDFQTEADVNRKLAHAYSTQGKFTAAEQCLLQAIKLDSIHGTGLDKIDNFRQIGALYAYKGEYLKALSFLKKAELLSKGMEASVKDVRRLSIGETYISLSQLHLTLGNYTDAERLAWRSRAIFNGLPSGKRGDVEALLVLGIIAREKNQYPQAHKYLTASLDLAKTSGENLARQYQAIGDLAMLQGKIEEAIRFKLNALEAAETSGIKPQIILANMRMGDAYQRLGDQRKGSLYYEKALAVQEETGRDTSAFSTSLGLRTGDAKASFDHYQRFGNAIGMALVSIRLGQFHFQQNRYDSATYFFNRAHETFTAIGNPEGTAGAAFGLAGVYEKQGKLTEASQRLREARSITLQPEMQWQISYHLGQISEKKEQPDSAYYYYSSAIEKINAMRGNLTVEEFKTLFSDSKVEVYDRIIRLLLKNKTYWKGLKMPVEELALNFCEQSRSRSFLDLLGNKKIVSKSAIDSTLLDQEQQLRLRLQQLNREMTSATGVTARQELQKLIALARNDHEEAIRRIKLNNPAYSTVINVDPIPPKLLQDQLDNATAIVEYWVGESATIVWVITRSRIQSFVLDVASRDVQREVKGFRNAISLRAAAAFATGSTTLYNKIFRPVVPALTGISNLVIVPHGPLHFIPFQALKNPGGKFMVENFVISYAPSISVLHYCMMKRSPVSKRLLAMALGDESVHGFDALPGTAAEVSLLKKLYDTDGAQSVIGKEFTETRFKENASQFSSIHLATHGVFNSVQPLFSYLLMHPSDADDGYLTIDEIFGLSINSDLVSLSACETALGDLTKGDELVGLSRAFMYAGASTVIVSLWKVEDATTAWLMNRFHQYLLQGKNSALALTMAQRDMIKKGSTPNKASASATKAAVPELESIVVDPNSVKNPANWAPFVLMGNGQN